MIELPLEKQNKTALNKWRINRIYKWNLQLIALEEYFQSWLHTIVLWSLLLSSHSFIHSSNSSITLIHEMNGKIVFKYLYTHVGNVYMHIQWIPFKLHYNGTIENAICCFLICKLYFVAQDTNICWTIHPGKLHVQLHFEIGGRICYIVNYKCISYDFFIIIII